MLDYIGQLSTPVVTDQVLEINRSNPYQTADLDLPKKALLNEAAHRLLGHVQDVRRLLYGVQRFGLLHGSAHHRLRWPFRARRSHGSVAGCAVNSRSRRWASSAELCLEGRRRAIM